MAFSLLAQHAVLGLIAAIITVCRSLMLFASLMETNASMEYCQSLLETGFNPVGFRDSRLQLQLLAFGFTHIASYIFAPSRQLLGQSNDNVDLEGTSHAFVALERNANRAQRRKSIGKVSREIFCLELSCFLLECSWQAYYLMGEGNSSKVDAIHDDDSNSRPAEVTKTQMDLQRLGLQLVKEMHSSDLSTSGYIARSHDGRHLVVSFRGSIDSANIVSSLYVTQIALQDLTIRSDTVNKVLVESGFQDLHGSKGVEDPGVASYSSLKVSAPSAALGFAQSIPVLKQSLPRVHSGFWYAYCSVREDFMRTIITCIAHHLRASYHTPKQSPQPLQILFCGHSLGGALSVLAAYELSLSLETIVLAVIKFLFQDSTLDHLNNWRPSVAVYTYGSPRLGNPSFAVRVKTMLRNYYRVEIDDDLVPMLPRFLGTYQHAGVQVLLDAESGGSILVKPTVVESFLLRKSRGSLANHTLNRYRDRLESCFEPQELQEYLSKELIGTSANSSKNSSFIDPSRMQLPLWMLARSANSSRGVGEALANPFFEGITSQSNNNPAYSLFR